jgi:hypothetical protein
MRAVRRSLTSVDLTLSGHASRSVNTSTGAEKRDGSVHRDICADQTIAR